MDDLFLFRELRRLAKLQRHATIVAGLSARRPGDPVTTVLEARILDAQIVKQAAAEVD